MYNARPPSYSPTESPVHHSRQYAYDHKQQQATVYPTPLMYGYTGHSSTEEAKQEWYDLTNAMKRLKIDLEVGPQISRGGFGKIYSGQYMGKNVVVKGEMVESEHHEVLETEYSIYKLLNAEDATTKTHYLGIPRCYLYGDNSVMGTYYNIMILHRMGPNLKMLHAQNATYFTPTTCFLIALQVLDHLKYIHARGIVHRDVKPENLVIAYTNDLLSRSCIYLLDFGLAEPYMKDQKYLPNVKRKGRTGTTRFMGMHAMRKESPSPRDDLQSLAYTLLFFVRGELPWDVIDEPDKKTKKRKVSAMKQALSSANICSGLDPIFQTFLDYTLQLEYDDPPDYEHMKLLFLHYFYSHNLTVDYSMLDWNKR